MGLSKHFTHRNYKLRNNVKKRKTSYPAINFMLISLRCK